MSPELSLAFGIAAAAAVLLFVAIGALISLMYLLTNPSIFGEPARARRRAKRTARRTKRRGSRPPAPEPVDPRQERIDEHDRRRRAAALAAAIARAEHESSAMPYLDAPSGWRVLHRDIRLRQRVGRLG